MILSALLTLLAAFAKSVMDRSANGSLPQKFNKDFTWRSKWKDGDPSKGEAFPGSSTVFVFLTDAWHFAQFVFLGCIFLLAATHEPIFSWWIDFILMRIIFGVAFELSYRGIVK